jgi:hypothetical protein
LWLLQALQPNQRIGRPHFLPCLFTIRVCSILISWLGLHDINTRDWHAIATVNDGLVQVVHERGETRKAMASFDKIVCWEIWKERNSQVLCNQAITLTVLASKIKDN